MGKVRMKEWMTDNAYLITLCCVLAMVVGCALYTRGIQQAQDVQAAAAAPEIEQTAAPTQRVMPLPTIAPLMTWTIAEQGGIWPLDGRILRPYDAQESTYWASLDAWQAHLGLDIAGEAGERVKACMDGTVKSVTYDPLWGWRVRIGHEGDRETVYAGLEGSTMQEGETRLSRSLTNV